MSDSTPKTDAPVITAQEVVDFLRAHPKFLQENPQVCDFLIPPKNSNGKNVADFQSFLIDRLKSDKKDVLETTREIVENARSNMNNQQRIHETVLRLLDARNFDEFIHITTMDLSAMLDTDISALLVESNGHDIPHISTNGIRILPEGTVDKWMQGKNILLQSNISGIEAIYGGGANLVQSQALLRIDISRDTPPALLVFGSRDPLMFQDGQGTEMVMFLARAFERIFRSWLTLPK
ncbi:MAG: DUF484 family protein [Rhodospirillales bacterium]|nr:DUF484 family protein [Alphaproteobacteria bacterium]USO03674.1 MAG: DUF484 family protein [Rhodospirillales bacterium]